MTVFQNLQPQAINAQTLKQRLESGSTVLIDVREAAEYATERIPGAKLQPLSQLNPHEISLAPTQPIVLYCQSGNRSAKAAQRFIEAGFASVSHLHGGLSTWKNAGYPVEKSENAPISLFRQVQIVAGSIVVLGTALGAFVSPWFLLLSGFVGGGLVFAGVTNTCMLGMLLAKLPYNQQAGQS